jgi:hypothetical protein
MIKGKIDLSWLDERELYLTKFVEETNTVWSGGYWKDNNMPVPDYPGDGPIVLQTYDDFAPMWAHKIKEMFSFVDYSMVTVNCIKPGRFKWDIKGKIPVRVNVFLQDKVMGHFLEIENQSFTTYEKGDYSFILKDQVHCVSNVSNINRYTLQVTGYAKTKDIQ